MPEAKGDIVLQAPPPTGGLGDKDPTQFQLQNLVFQLNNGIPKLRFAVQNNPPKKPRAGDVVFADGTNWNPGSGQGFYGFYATAWHFLG